MLICGATRTHTAFTHKEICRDRIKYKAIRFLVRIAIVVQSYRIVSPISVNLSSEQCPLSISCVWISKPLAGQTVRPKILQKLSVSAEESPNFSLRIFQKTFFRFLFTEFPAVLLNIATGQVESEFHQFVRPTNYPMLSDYCRQLTGITQQKIERSNPFPEVFRAFLQWLNDVTAQKQLVFYTRENLGRMAGQNATFCTWSSFDLRHFFQLEMVNHRLIRPASMAVWIDFEVEYKVSSYLPIREILAFVMERIFKSKEHFLYFFRK